MTRLAMLLMLTLVAGCASTPRVVAPVTAVSPPLRPQGLDRVLGHNAAQLVAIFGPADQDVHDHDARKLQFRSAICVLDAYLYPGRGGGEPTVSYLDARQADGRDIDRASCVAAIVRRREAQ